MSDNLIIREDGIGRLIRGVDALEIKLQNGGTSRWVRFNPRDQKSVNANGEYHAKDDGVDGYRTITVNVPTRTKSQEPGRDQEIFNPDTGTGYYTDDNGLLHEEVVPDEIRIMHVPDKTTYQDGEPIDLEGIVVQAYRDGEVWTSEKYPDGYIPVHELTVDKIYKSANQFEVDNPESFSCFKLNHYGRWGLNYPLELLDGNIEYTYDISTDRAGENIKWKDCKGTIQSNAFILWSPTTYAISLEPFTIKCEYIWYSRYSEQQLYSKSYVASPHINMFDSNLTCYTIKIDYDIANKMRGDFFCKNLQPEFIDLPFPTWTSSDNDSWTWPDQIAYILKHGYGKIMKKVEITWPRPKDNKILSTSFNITVEAPS